MVTVTHYEDIRSSALPLAVRALQTATQSLNTQLS
jgi:hypothetical protein